MLEITPALGAWGSEILSPLANHSVFSSGSLSKLTVFWRAFAILKFYDSKVSTSLVIFWFSTSLFAEAPTEGLLAAPTE